MWIIINANRHIVYMGTQEECLNFNDDIEYTIVHVNSLDDIYNLLRQNFKEPKNA